MTENKKVRKSIGNTARFGVVIYADEYEGLGLDPSMKKHEAGAVLRARLGLALPMRQRQTASVSGLTQAITKADGETRARIVELLNGLE